MPLLERLHAVSPQLALAVTIGFSRELLEAYDAGELDAVIVRQEGSRRGEKLTEDEFGWFASPRFRWRRGESLPLATLAPPCGVRALAVRALDKAGMGMERDVRRRRRHRRGGRRPRRACGGTIGTADRASGTGRTDRRWPASARILEGDAASKVGDPAKLVARRTLAVTLRQRGRGGD